MKKRREIRDSLDEALRGIHENPFMYERVKARVTERNEKVKKKMRLCVLTALLITITAAFAENIMGNGRLLEFFSSTRGISAGLSAGETVVTDVATADFDNYTIRVRSAAYDGKAVRIEAVFEGKNGIVIDKMYDGEDLINGESAEDYAKRNGKQIFEGVVDIELGNAEWNTRAGLEVREGETLVVYNEIVIEGECPDKLEAWVSFSDGNLNGDRCEFVLNKTNGEITEYKALQYDSMPFMILEFTVKRTQFADYITVLYDIANARADEVADLYDPSVKYYATRHGIWCHTDPNCMGMANAEEYTINEALALGKMPCRVCCGDYQLSQGYWGFVIEGEGFVLNYDGCAVSVNGENVDISGHEYLNGGELTFVMRSGTVPDTDLTITPAVPGGYEPYSTTLERK